MRRILAFFLILTLLCPPVQAVQQEKYVALTFDDGPSGRFTRRLLEGLETRDVKVTFLLCGYRMAQSPQMAQVIFDRGHEIGLHGYSHDNMAKMTYREAEKEICETLALLPQGCKPTFLRPPGGSCGKAAAEAAADHGLALLNWSVDPRDWCTHDALAVEAAVVSTVQDGDIILLHDMCDCSVDAALAIVDRLRDQGFTFVTVSELAQRKNTIPQPGRMYLHFR